MYSLHANTILRPVASANMEIYPLMYELYSFVLLQMFTPTVNSLWYDKMLTHIHTVCLYHGDNL